MTWLGSRLCVSSKQLAQDQTLSTRIAVIGDDARQHTPKGPVGPFATRGFRCFFQWPILESAGGGAKPYQIACHRNPSCGENHWGREFQGGPRGDKDRPEPGGLARKVGRVPGPDREAVPGEPSRAARAGREVPDPAAESGSSWGWQCQEDGGVPETDPRLAGDCGGNEGRSVDTSRAHPQDLLCTLEKHCTRRICYCGVGFFQLAPQHDCWQTSRRGGLPIEPP